MKFYSFILSQKVHGHYVHICIFADTMYRATLLVCAVAVAFEKKSLHTQKKAKTNGNK